MVSYREEEEYEFRVGKTVILPDGTENIILTGPDGHRFMIPSENYSKYNLSAGNFIRCRVDKINCKGRIFLEPENPWYSEGQYYFFRVKRTETRTGFAGKPVRVVIVEDLSGGETPVEFRRGRPGAGTRVKLLVERISKGRLFLRREYVIKRGTLMKTGRKYLFKVTGLTTGIDGRDYFIISDPYRKNHLLPMEYYKSYGIVPGGTFSGSIVRFRSNGELVIEPENPYFTAGEVLKMHVTSSTKDTETGSFHVNLTDPKGFTHCVEMDTAPQDEDIDCVVKKIRKGKPLFEAAPSSGR